jgi:hypothetical protein
VSLGGTFDGFARIAGIVAIFAIVGPLAFAAQVVLVMAGFNAPLIELLKMLLKLDTVNTLVSVAVWVLAITSMLAAIPPSIIAGFIFALAAVGTGLKAVWMAWLAVAVAISGIFSCSTCWRSCRRRYAGGSPGRCFFPWRSPHEHALSHRHARTAK